MAVGLFFESRFPTNSSGIGDNTSRQKNLVGWFTWAAVCREGHAQITIDAY